MLERPTFENMSFLKKEEEEEEEERMEMYLCVLLLSGYTNQYF